MEISKLPMDEISKDTENLSRVPSSGRILRNVRSEKDIMTSGRQFGLT